MSDRLQTALGAAYRIERELGGGGMSRVFLATQVGLKRPVVIKLLPPELTSEVMAARFNPEMEVTAGLQHPHILPVLANGSRDGLLYYITPFVAAARVYDQDHPGVDVGKIVWMLDRGRVNQRLGNRQRRSIRTRT